MSFESPKINSNESPQDRLQQYRQEALVIAQRMSQRWRNLRDKKEAIPTLLAETPELEEIDSLSSPSTRTTGIQRYFESQVEFIKKQSGDIQAQSQMMYHLKQKLESLEQQLNTLGI